MRRYGSIITALVAFGTLAVVSCSSDTGTQGTELPPGTGGGAGRGALTGGAVGTTGGTGGGTTGGSGGSGAVIGTGGGIPTTGGAGPATGGAVGSGGSGGACVGDKATGMKGQSAVLMLLVDTSLSMDSPAPGDDQTKLEATIEALNTAIAALPDALTVGLIFYPQVPVCMTMMGETCDCFNENVAVPIAPLDAAQRAALTGAVTGVMADGSTPTHDAYQYALQQLQASTFEGQKYVVLITDGEPTFSLGCVGTGLPPGVDTQPLVDESAAANTTNMIKTFVIGSPGSQNAATGLSAMARLGGTGPAGCDDSGTPEYCHFDMTESDDVSAALTEALGQISDQIPIDCNFAIPAPPNSQDTIDTSRVNVSYNGMPVGYDQSCMAASAWRFDDPVAPTQVIFCNTLCDQVKADMMSEVQLEFGCTRIDVPR